MTLSSKKRRSHRNLIGTTLIELMIAVSIMGIISIGVVGAFATISKSIQFSKNRSLASNLAQEQMQIMKQKSFNKILVTTSTLHLTNFTPNIPYDSGYYPPESILEAGVRFTRYTYVQVADENSGTLQYFGAVPDTGMKAILVTVTWTQGIESKKLQLRNIVTNSDAVVSNSIFSGRITIYPAGTIGIPNAQVTMAENVGYADQADASGNYTINLSPGNFSMYVSADGYFPQYRQVSISANSSQTQDFQLIAMGSGTVRGTVWLNDHPVISQVVGSSQNAAGFCQEYVEIFNPTTYTWLIDGNIELGYVRFGGSSPTFIDMDYNVDNVNPSSYYLFANTSPVTVAGVSRTADAVYETSNADFPDIIRIAGADPCGAGGGTADLVGIAWTSTGEAIDFVGWSQDPNPPPDSEGNPISQTVGLENNEQYIRRSSTSGVISGLGRTYDSNDNATDYVVQSPIIYPPFNSSSTQTVVSGTPAYGALVSATDGLSSVVTASAAGSPPVAEFQLTSVATGTWTVFTTSKSCILDISSVVVTANNTTYIPNAVSTPTWPSSAYHATILSEAATQGYISGWVKSSGGLPISPSITVQAPGQSVPAGTSNGMYLMPILPGTYDVIANPGNLISSYISVTSQTVVVSVGQVHSDVNFTLSQGGRIRGFVTRDGINPLPGVAVAAYDSNGWAIDQEVSASDGRYTLVNLSTGVYSVEPVLGSGEASNPVTSVVTVTAGSLVSAATFTITGAFGTVRGNATIGADPIRTGVLIVCSTTTLPTGPPSLNSATLSGAGYYIGNSYEDGTYSLDVRGSTSTTYRLYAYYTTFTGNTPVISSRTVSGVSITAGQTTSGVDFAW